MNVEVGAGVGVVGVGVVGFGVGVGDGVGVGVGDGVGVDVSVGEYVEIMTFVNHHTKKYPFSSPKTRLVEGKKKGLSKSQFSQYLNTTFW